MASSYSATAANGHGTKPTKEAIAQTTPLATPRMRVGKISAVRSTVDEPRCRAFAVGDSAFPAGRLNRQGDWLHRWVANRIVEHAAPA